MAVHDPIDLAYAAGIMDGEGWIGITVQRGKRTNRVPNYVAKVSVTQIDSVIPNRMADLFGGTVHSYEPRSSQKNGTHNWRLAGKRAIECCRLLEPFLLLKRQQARLVIAYADDPRIQHGRRGYPGIVVPQAEVETKEEYKMAISALNMRKGRWAS